MSLCDDRNEGFQQGSQGLVRRGRRVPFDVEVRGPVAGDVWDQPFAALVETWEVGGGGADGRGVEEVEGGRKGREGGRILLVAVVLADCSCG